MRIGIRRDSFAFSKYGLIPVIHAAFVVAYDAFPPFINMVVLRIAVPNYYGAVGAAYFA